VRQLTTNARWRTNIGGTEKEFDTEITEQKPDKRIAWRSLAGASHARRRDLFNSRSSMTDKLEVMLQ